MRNIILIAILLTTGSISTSAQFYTITKESEIRPQKRHKVTSDTLQKPLTGTDSCKISPNDSLPTMYRREQSGQKGYNRTSPKTELPKTSLQRTQSLPTQSLPELTIPNLYREIIRNGIQHPKVVLAQAILETGWFTSSLCRNRHNLFGLTNPKTGKYYEFNHWIESVRAYYTKVQYKYKGGNYLLWLRDIGYAENPHYINEVVKVLMNL